jgi:ABC transporter substrate binding protein (PQQ-dependent alcohol dehydrogenase system)
MPATARLGSPCARSATPSRIRDQAIPRPCADYLLTPDFTVAAFRGEKLTVRAWNQQLRQPILLTDGRGTVSVSPQEGFLHRTSELDTLGFDQPETKCKLQ